jgi:rhodanese-related sulfurtransferase
MTAKSITVRELDELRARNDDLVVIDVRSAEEYAAGHVEGAVHAPKASLPELALSAHRRVVTVCTKGGGRSQDAASALTALGVDVAFLEGGTLAWQALHPDRS